MKNKFTKAIAKEIAKHQFGWTLDCVIGNQDPDYSLNTSIDEFEQEFSEELENRDIIITPKRIEVINKCYLKMVENALVQINKLYPKTK